MGKKAKKWIDFIGTKKLIAIGALIVLLIAIIIGVVVSNNAGSGKANKEDEESTGLKVEQNADDAKGDSIDFSEFLTEDEKKNESTPSGNGGTGTTPSGNGGTGTTPSGNDGTGTTPSGNDGTGNKPSGDGGISAGEGEDGNKGDTTSSDVPFGPLF